jgi:uncharacterized protein (DUF1778 family)
MKAKHLRKCLTIGVRVTQAERARLNRAARRNFQTVAAFVRGAALSLAFQDNKFVDSQKEKRNGSVR